MPKAKNVVYYDKKGTKTKYIEKTEEVAKKKKINAKSPLMYRYNGKIFARSSMAEHNLDKDLCEFSKDEIINMYTDFFTGSLDYLNDYNSLYRQYYNWALEQGYTKNLDNPFSDIDLGDLRKCLFTENIESTVITREMLNKWAGLWVERYSEPYNRCDLAVVYLLFEGVKGEHYDDLRSVTFDDVNYKKGTIKVKSGRTIKLDPKCVELIRTAEDDKVYYMPSGKQFPFLDRRIFRAFRKDQLDDDRTMTAKVNTLKVRVEKILTTLGIEKVTLNSIYAWGQVDYLSGLIKEDAVDYIVTLPENDREEEMKKYIKVECSDNMREKFGMRIFTYNSFYEKYKEYLCNGKLKEKGVF